MATNKPNTRVVAYDPNNNLDGGVVNNEDLTMFVDLAVSIPSRNYQDNVNNIKNKGKGTTFAHTDTIMGGTKINGEQYLTTDYITMSFTDIQNGTRTREMFGVESIDISFDPQFFPIVTMNFIDVRGLSLMQPMDENYKNAITGKDVDQTNVDSSKVFFSALFNFPYPTFTLTVKGYYGPIVKFDLRVEDFKSAFDAATGNFRCTVRFIGAMYGSLAEIPASYVLCAPYFDSKDGTTEGTLWKNLDFKYYTKSGGEGRPMDTVLQLIEKYRNIMTGNTLVTEDMKKTINAGIASDKLAGLLNAIEAYHKAVKFTNNAQDALRVEIGTVLPKRYIVFIAEGGKANNVINAIDAFKSAISTYKKDNESLIKENSGLSNAIDNIEKKIKYFEGIIPETTGDNVSKTEEYLRMFYRREIVNETSTPSYWYTGEEAQKEAKDFTSPLIINPNDYLDYDIDQLTNDMKNISVEGTDKPTKEKIKDELLKKGADGLGAAPSFTEDITAINALKESKNSEYQEKTTDTAWTSEQIRTMVNFDPTIKNIYKVYFAHLYTLILHMVNTINNVSGKRFSNVSGYKFDDKDPASYSIFPFPFISKEVSENGEKVNKVVYPITDDNVSSYIKNSAEGILVENIFNGVTHFGKKMEEYISEIEAFSDKLEKSENGGGTTTTTATYNFKPCHTFDYFITGGPYNNILSGIEDNEEQCANEIISMLLLRYIAFWKSGMASLYGDAKRARETFIANEVHNLSNAILSSKIDETKRGAVFTRIKNTSDERFAIIFNEKIGNINELKLENGKISGKYANTPNDVAVETFVAVDKISSMLTDYKNNNGVNNKETKYRLFNGGNYKDLSTKCISDVTAVTVDENDSAAFKDWSKDENLIWGWDRSAFDIPSVEWVNKNYSDKDESFKKKSCLFLMLYFYYVNENGVKTKKNFMYTKKSFDADDMTNIDGLIQTNDKFAEKDNTVKIKGNSNCVYKLRLLDALRLGAYCWAFNNFGDSFQDHVTWGNVTVSTQRHYGLDYISEDKSGGDPLILLDLTVNGVYGTTLQPFLKIFEQWAEDDNNSGDCIATIGNGVKLYNFYKYYEIKDGKVGRRKGTKGGEFTKIVDAEGIDSSNSFFTKTVYFHVHNVHPDAAKGITFNDVNTFANDFKTKLEITKTVQNYSPVAEEVKKMEASQKHKTNIYYTLKNIYDKFLLNNDKDNFALTGDNTEFSKMKFYNNFMHDISHEMDVPFDGVIKILDKYLSTDKSPSFIELLAETAQINKCLFLTLPFTCDVENDALFKPVKWWDYSKGESSSNSFIVLQPGETSKNLNTKNNKENDYLDDGYDIALSDNDAVDCPLSNQAKAFAVTYARQTQNYFTSVSVNMDNPTPTDESIANLLDISKMGGDGAIMRATPMKTSLYPVYANRSYNCTVEMMGDMGIMPLMYFQLNNVPMFRGAYMITNVSHRIRPGEFTTTFTGTRVSKFKVPLPDNTIFFNSLIEMARKAMAMRTVNEESEEIVGSDIGQNGESEDYTELFKSKGLVNIKDIDPSIMVEMKYATSDNFMKKNMYGNLKEAYFVEAMANKIKEAQSILKSKNENYTLLIYDAARPDEVQCQMRNWANDKYGDSAGTYVANCGVGKGTHTYGIAVDVTIYDKTAKDVLDMGSGFDHFNGPGRLLSGGGHPSKVTKDEIKQYVYSESTLKEKSDTVKDNIVNNRYLLCSVMTDKKVGLSAYGGEWWHFDWRGTDGKLSRNNGIYLG